MQRLFRRDSDSSSLNSSSQDSIDECDLQKDAGSTSMDDGGSQVVQREIGHLVLEERVTPTIATRLWPAAEHLAHFVLSVAQGKITSVDVDCTNKLEKEDETITVVRKAHDATVWHCLFNHLQEEGHKPLWVLELGAGIGLTGLEISTQIPIEKLLLTEQEEGIPLLRNNIRLNRDRMKHPSAMVDSQLLDWFQHENHVQKAMEWFHSSESQLQQPLLILGSDLVYWDELHQPLEETLTLLLKQAKEGSICLLAGMRRWKRDNAFYQMLGRRKRPGLECICLQETITRRHNKGGDEKDSPDQKREIIRVYAIRYIE